MPGFKTFDLTKTAAPASHGILFFWCSSVPFARLQTLQTSPKLSQPFAAAPTSHGILFFRCSSMRFARLQNPPQLTKTARTLRHSPLKPRQSVLTLFKRAVCQVSKPSNTHQNCRTPSLQLPGATAFCYAVQACRLPGFKIFQKWPNPPTSHGILFLRCSRVPFARLQNTKTAPTIRGSS